MSHLELLEALRAVPHNELRSDTSELFEMVFRKEVLAQLTGVLDRFFGLAAKPTGQNPSSDVKKQADAYGGIWKDQAFYITEWENETYVAMLWPWGNGILITLKLFRKK